MSKFVRPLQFVRPLHMNIKKLLTLLLLLLLLIGVTQAIAHPDYSQELFSYSNSAGEGITVEKYFTDGVYTTDPVKLRVIKKDKTVVYEGDWTTSIQSIQESNNRRVILEYEEIVIPPKVTVFENGEFHEGEASLYSHMTSLFKQIINVLPSVLFFAMLYLLTQGSSIIYKIVVSIFLLMNVLMLGGLTFLLTLLVIYPSTKFILNKVGVSVDRQKRTIKYILFAGLIYFLYEIGPGLLDLVSTLLKD